ncbi:MAG: major capsid protein [Burkholderiales bacterium]|jgi:hypothetical protein|nr:major capsid protein [Burkholderiales bacterium]
MADIGLFNEDVFSVSSLTAAINEQDKAPSRIGDLGIFDEEGISTTTVNIEKDGDVLSLVPAASRGASGTVVNDSKRIMIPFNCVHLPLRATIMADEIQNVRAFGTSSELETLQVKVNKRLGKMRRRIDVTHEWHRVGAIKGKVLDADATTVLLDIYKTFEVDQKVREIDFSNTNLEIRLLIDDFLCDIEDALKGQTFTGARVLCGHNIWRWLITLKTVKETFLNTQMASDLRDDPREAFSFGGVTWERYRGSVGAVSFIGADEAYVVPEGVPELFMSNFAPANYMETVNTEGVPYYAKQRVLEFDKGVELEAQSNPLHICTRPSAIIRLAKA